ASAAPKRCSCVWAWKRYISNGAKRKTPNRNYCMNLNDPIQVLKRTYCEITCCPILPHKELTSSPIGAQIISSNGLGLHAEYWRYLSKLGNVREDYAYLLIFLPKSSAEKSERREFLRLEAL